MMIIGGGIRVTSLPDGRFSIGIGQEKFDISENYSKNVNPLNETFYRKHVSLPQFCNIQGLVQNKVFKACLVDGPSVIYPRRGKLEYCKFNTEEPGDDVFIEVPAGKRISGSGIILLLDCQFEGCVFRGISIAGTAKEIEVWRRSFGGEN